MRNRIFINTALFCCFVVCLFFAGDLNGKWTGALHAPDGNDYPLNYTFKIDGDKLTGTGESPQGPIDAERNPNGRSMIRQRPQRVSQRSRIVERNTQRRRDPSGVTPGGARRDPRAVDDRDGHAAFLQKPCRRQPDDAGTHHDRRSRSDPADVSHREPPGAVQGSSDAVPVSHSLGGGV